MRSEEEIQDMFNNLGDHEEDGTNALDWKGDNFKYGYFAGKAEALAWVLGEKNMFEMNVSFDFEDYVRQQQEERDKRRGLSDSQ